MLSLLEGMLLTNKLTIVNSLNGNNREPDYQIMVFCTSVEGAANPPALMEFPHVCEIKMSGRVLEAVSHLSRKSQDQNVDMIILA